MRKSTLPPFPKPGSTSERRRSSGAITSGLERAPGYSPTSARVGPAATPPSARAAIGAAAAVTEAVIAATMPAAIPAPAKGIMAWAAKNSEAASSRYADASAFTGTAAATFGAMEAAATPACDPCADAAAAVEAASAACPAAPPTDAPRNMSMRPATAEMPCATAITPEMPCTASQPDLSAPPTLTFPASSMARFFFSQYLMDSFIPAISSRLALSRRSW